MSKHLQWLCLRIRLTAPGSVAARRVRDEHGAGADSAVYDAVAVDFLQAVGHIQNDRSGVLQWQPIWEALHIAMSPIRHL